jgi:hypothetical protein
MSNNRITPFVKRMRTNGGTIYTFSSAVEDIGLNINERNNVVKISHFALLDIPPINYDSGDLDRNFFNIKAIDGAFEYEADSASIKDGRVLIAESFQNYALNLESNFLNRSNYDPTLIRTVSERVFWKWLKETGAIRFDKDTSVGSKQYWGEEIDADGSLGYNRVVKYIGRVSAGNVRTDSFGTYNETYVLVPTSHGQTDAYFELVEDDNYKHGMEIGDLPEKILGRDTYTLPHPDGLSYNGYYDFVDSSTTIAGGSHTLQYDNSTGVWTDGWWYTAEGIEPSSTDNAYLTDSSIYQSSGIYNVDLQYTGGTDDFAFRRSKVDCLSMVFSLEELKGIYNDTDLTYDKMAIQYAINDAFNFNAVLIYYTVYNSTEDEVLERNLLGVLFIDAPTGNSQDIGFSGISIPSLEKIMSGPGGFGTSYSLRLNIKTDNMVDDTGATIVDQATSDQLYAEDWTAAFANLNTAVNLLTQNTGTIHHISEQYVEVQTTQTQILNDLQALQFQVNDIGRDIQGETNTIAMFADGDDPLVESSIYMKFGNVGVKNDNPKYPLHISGTTKADEIIIENAIRDVSGNILLGYGSPLQIGASTNYREVEVYTGGSDPGIKVDTSNNVYFDKDVCIGGGLYIDGSSTFFGTVIFDGSIFSSSFDFSESYLTPTAVGSGLEWDGAYFNVVASSDVSAAGPNGSIQLSNGSALSYDPSLIWDGSALNIGGSGIFTENSAEFVIKGITNAGGFPDFSSISSDEVNFITYAEGTGKRALTIGNTDDTALSTWAHFYDGNAPATRFISFGTNNTERLRIIGNGSIGVNKTSPGATLDIDGDLRVSSLPSSITSNVVYYNTTSGALSYGAGGGGGDVAWSSDNVGSNNQLITSNGDGSIVAESNLTFDGNILEFDSATDKTIKLKDLTSIDNTPQTLNILGAKGFGSTYSTTQIGPYTYTSFAVGLDGGDVKVQAGQGAEPNSFFQGNDRGGAGGDLLLYGGPGGDPNGRKGNVVLDGYVVQVDSNYLDISSRLRHTGNTQTFIQFDTNIIRLCASVNFGVYEQQTIYSGGVVFNEDSQDYDFRIESDGDSSIFFVDGGSNSVWINKTAGVRISNTEVVFNEHSNDVDFRIETDANANALFIDSGLDRTFMYGPLSQFSLNADAYVNIIGDDVVGGDTYLNINDKFAIEVRSLSSTDGTGTGIRFTTGSGNNYTGTAAIVGRDNGGFGAGELIFAVRNSTSSTPPSTMPVFHCLSGVAQLGHWYNSVGTEKIRFNLSSGQIDAAGDIVAYTSIFSDKRLKENIKPIGSSLDKILQLEGISYDRKSNGESHIGLIAQEVEKVIPEVVVEKPLPLETEGDEETLYKTIRYSELIPYLIESIKELKAEIEELKKSK